MKIKNNLVLALSVIALILGIFNGSIALQEEIDRILTYSTNYERFTLNITLFCFLVFRYLKYILAIQFFTIGYFGKVVTVIIAMVKSYAYGFTIAILTVSFSGFEVLKKLSLITMQMTLSLIITLLFAQITMNYLQNKYPVNKKREIQIFAFGASFVGCIVIGFVDFILIKLI